MFCSPTSFLHHQRPHVPPAEVEGHLTAQTLQQVLRSVLQVERALVLQGEQKRQYPRRDSSLETAAGTDLDGEDEDSTPGHHVEEQDHGFILVGGVGVKYPLGHHVTLRRKNETSSDLISKGHF